MKLNRILRNSELEETTSHGKDDYPLEIYTDEVAKYPEGYICWHWHKEYELIYLLEGSIKFYTGQNQYILQEGEGAWIASDMMHSMHPLSPADHCTMCAILVSPFLLYGFPGSRIHKNYILPLFERAILTHIF